MRVLPIVTCLLILSGKIVKIPQPKHELLLAFRWLAFLSPYSYLTIFMTFSCAVSVSIGSAEDFQPPNRQLLGALDVANNSSSTSRNALLKTASLENWWCSSSARCTLDDKFPICVKHACVGCSTDSQCKLRRWGVPYCNADGTCGRTCTLDAQCASVKKSKPFCSTGSCVNIVSRAPDSSLATVSLHMAIILKLLRSFSPYFPDFSYQKLVFRIRILSSAGCFLQIDSTFISKPNQSSYCNSASSLKKISDQFCLALRRFIVNVRKWPSGRIN